MRFLIALAGVAGLCLALSAAAADEPPRKDAAESVGEGNASRWLDYYRRERGDNWDAKPAGESPAPPAQPKDQPQQQPAEKRAADQR
jgi:hypothetical protein